MLMLEALQEFPVGKKGYFLWGDPTAMRVLQRTYFSDASYADSLEQVASAGSGAMIIPEDLAADSLEYLALPKSDKTYLYLFDRSTPKHSFNLTHVDSHFKKLKLPRIDCTDPDTPKDKRVAVEYLCKTLKVSETMGWAIGKRTQWSLATILNITYSWTCLTTDKLSDKQATNLIETLLPSNPLEVFVDAVIEKKVNKIDYSTLDNIPVEEVFRALSATVDKMRILKTVLSENPTHYATSDKTGLTPDELKRYTPLVKSMKTPEIVRWSDALQWAYLRKDNPRSIQTLINLMMVV